MSDNPKNNVATRPLIQSNTPTSFTDNVHIASRNDGIVFLQFISDTPAVLMENFRTTMTKAAVVRLIDTLSQVIDHYPIKKNTLMKTKSESINKKSK